MGSSSGNYRKRAKVLILGGPKGLIQPMDSAQSAFNLTDAECKALKMYTDIFIAEKFEAHYQVNDYITETKQWDAFKLLRSNNNHGNGKIVKGIQPNFFKAICFLLGVSGENGDPLESYECY